MVSSPQERKKEGMGSATPLVDKMAEVEQVAVVVQTPQRDNSLQNASPLEHFHETYVGKLLINLLLPTQ